MIVLMFLKVIPFIVLKMYIEVKTVENAKILFLQMVVETQNIFLLAKEVQIVVIVLE